MHDRSTRETYCKGNSLHAGEYTPESSHLLGWALRVMMAASSPLVFALRPPRSPPLDLPDRVVAGLRPWAGKRSRVPSLLQRSKQVCQGPYLSGGRTTENRCAAPGVCRRSPCGARAIGLRLDHDRAGAARCVAGPIGELSSSEDGVSHGRATYHQGRHRSRSSLHTPWT